MFCKEGIGITERETLLQTHIEHFQMIAHFDRNRDGKILEIIFATIDEVLLDNEENIDGRRILLHRHIECIE